MRTIDDTGPIRNFIQFLDENGALGFELFHDMPVVDDFLPYINRTRVELQGNFNDIDGPFHTGTESARLGQEHLGWCLRWLGILACHRYYASRFVAVVSSRL